MKFIARTNLIDFCKPNIHNLVIVINKYHVLGNIYYIFNEIYFSLKMVQLKINVFLTFSEKNEVAHIQLKKKYEQEIYRTKIHAYCD